MLTSGLELVLVVGKDSALVIIDHGRRNLVSLCMGCGPTATDRFETVTEECHGVLAASSSSCPAQIFTQNFITDVTSLRSFYTGLVLESFRCTLLWVYGVQKVRAFSSHGLS